METSFFSTKGRIRRRAFWARFFTLQILMGLFGLFGGSIESILGLIIYSLIGLFLIITFLIQGAKRMHDLNQDGIYFLIPVYNLIAALFFDGTVGNNEYGEDPKWPRDPISHK